MMPVPFAYFEDMYEPEGRKMYELEEKKHKSLREKKRNKSLKKKHTRLKKKIIITRSRSRTWMTCTSLRKGHRSLKEKKHTSFKKIRA